MFSLRQFTHNTVYAGTFHTHTGSTGSMRSSYDSTAILARSPGMRAMARNQYEAVVDFGHFKLEKAAQECVAGTRNRDFGIVVLVVNIVNSQLSRCRPCGRSRLVSVGL